MRREQMGAERRPVSQEERIGSNRRKLTYGERQGIAQDIRSTEENNDPTKLPPEMKRQQEQRKMMLAHDEDLEARGGEKDRLNARRKEIESVLKTHMPSKTEMWAKDPNDHQRAVHHNLAYQEKYKHLEQEWQDIMTKLEPDDPYAHSLENIRPDR